MQIQELLDKKISELSFTDPGIKTHLTKLGYRSVGKGKDQTTWSAPDGGILKIFGTQKGQQGFTEDQRMFAAWVKYTEDNASNRYMPRFGEWYSFEYPPESGQKYLQIKMERLTPISDSLMKGLLDQFDIFVEMGRTYEYLVQIVKQKLGAKFNGPLVQSLFKDRLLWDTVLNLHSIAERKGWGLDLHSSNYMLRGGQIIIVDPWVASS
jgi:hypothetical protein